MFRTGMWLKCIAWGLPLATACSLAQAPLRPMARRNVGHAPKTAMAAPVIPATPPAPATLSEMPSTPPQVTYQSGLLTIVAQNSTLGDILREVHRSTGAAIDVPANATERVVAKIGPGPAQGVLATLLNGSGFNYVMLGSAADPTSLSSVMLTTKPRGGGEVAASTYQPQPQQQYVVNQPVMAPGTGPGGAVVQPAEEGEDAAEEEEKDEEDPAEEEDQAQGQVQNGAAPADGSRANEGPKTPEQILEMLRQRRIPGQQVLQPPNQQQQPDDNN